MTLVTSTPQRDLVGGRYRLVDRLGDGAGGVVWRAEDTELGCEVAVKLVHGGRFAQPSDIQALHSEAELCARMMSPHVVKVLGHGVDESAGAFLALELLEGESLADLLAREERLSLVGCVTVVVHACRALSRAHSIGVIHRDIKPQNLFVTEDGGRMHVRLLDFGIALRADPERASGDRLSGTWEFMAPEVLLEGKAATPQSDLYSVGAVAYRCFTGAVPHPGASVGSVLLAHAAGPPAAPSSRRPVRHDLKARIDTWFARALARSPADRFASASDMAEHMLDVANP